MFRERGMNKVHRGGKVDTPLGKERTKRGKKGKNESPSPRYC